MWQESKVALSWDASFEVNKTVLVVAPRYVKKHCFKYKFDILVSFVTIILLDDQVISDPCFVTVPLTTGSLSLLSHPKPLR